MLWVHDLRLKTPTPLQSVVAELRLTPKTWIIYTSLTYSSRIQIIFNFDSSKISISPGLPPFRKFECFVKQTGP